MFLKKWLKLNKVTVQSLLKYSNGLISHKALYGLTNHPNPRLKQLLVFQQIASRRKRRHVSISELYGYGRSCKKNDPSQWILCDLLKVRQIRQKEIAVLCGVTLAAAKLWTKRPTTMRIKTIAAIAQFLNVEIEELFDPKTVAKFEKVEKIPVNLSAKAKINFKSSTEESSIAIADSAEKTPFKQSRARNYQSSPILIKPRHEKNATRSPLELPSHQSRTKKPKVSISGIPEKINQSLDRFIAEHYTNKGKPKI
jgi:transcriptional regulator with XRE-family HTH domain